MGSELSMTFDTCRLMTLKALSLTCMNIKLSFYLSRLHQSSHSDSMGLSGYSKISLRSHWHVKEYALTRLPNSKSCL